MSGVGSFLGGLTSGMVAGAKLGNAVEEMKFRREANDRQRKEWEAKDAVGKAFSDGMAAQENGGLASVVQQAQQAPEMSVAPAVAEEGSQVSPQGLATQRPEMSTAPQQAAAKPAGLTGVDPEVSRMHKIMRASNAAMEEAARQGNWELFSKNFKMGSDARDALRKGTLDAAERQFAMTGDWGAYVPAYNNFVADDKKIDSIVKNENGGYTISLMAGEDGKAIKREVKDDTEMKSMVARMMNPEEVRKHEAAMALKKFEFAAKREEAVALERAKGEERQKLEEVKTAGRIEVNAKRPAGLSSRAGGGGGDASKGAKFDQDADGNRVIIYRNGQMVYPKDADGNPVKIKIGTDEDQKFTRKLVNTWASKDITPPSDPVAKAQELTQRTGGKQSAPSLPSGLPEGSKQIGTSGGKPVYQAPNGKKFIAE